MLVHGVVGVDQRVFFVHDEPIELLVRVHHRLHYPIELPRSHVARDLHDERVFHAVCCIACPVDDRDGDIIVGNYWNRRSQQRDIRFQLEVDAIRPTI